MSDRIRLRRVLGYEFFNNYPDVCSVVRPGGLDALGDYDRRVAQRFISSFEGCRRVLDVGCGSGFPGLYVAPYVNELVGVDAAPNMVDLAKKNCDLLGVENASFEVGGVDGLRFAAEEFDGVMLCGLLESLDWQGVDMLMPEVHRVIAPDGRVAALDQDWRDILNMKGSRQAAVRLEDKNVVLRFVERTTSPHLERDSRYVLAPDSPLGLRLVTELGARSEAPVNIGANELEPESVVDAWYTELAQFDQETFRSLFASRGFRNV